MTNSLSIPRRKSRNVLSDGAIIARVKTFLDMWYSVSDLCDELGFEPRSFRQIIQHEKIPFRKDSNGKMWIHGHAFRDAVLTLRAARKKAPMPADYAFCATCHAPRKMLSPVTVQRGKVPMNNGKCEKCGRLIWRLVGRGKNGQSR